MAIYQKNGFYISMHISTIRDNMCHTAALYETPTLVGLRENGVSRTTPIFLGLTSILYISIIIIVLKQAAFSKCGITPFACFLMMQIVGELYIYKTKDYYLMPFYIFPHILLLNYEYQIYPRLYSLHKWNTHSDPILTI